MELKPHNQNRALLGWIGVLGACAVWIASGFALAIAMHQISHASNPPARTRASSSELAMMFWCAAFTLLQLTSFLLFAFVLRASWRLRSAVCFTLAAGLVMVGDAAGLLALLVWLGVTLGAA